MKLNRRSVLGAIGLVGVGTGAAFGSGAFTSTTAERAVEVNVFGADAGPIGVVEVSELGGGPEQQQTAQEEIAETITNNTVDVLVDISSDSVAVRANSDDTVFNDGTALFPNPTTGDSVYGQNSGDSFDDGSNIDNEEDYVSLVANDVTIVFGSGDSDGADVPPNSVLTYDPFFAFADPQDNGSSVEFQTTASTNAEQLLTAIAGNSVDSADDAGVNFSAVNNRQEKSAEISTGTADTETEGLDIVIGQSN